jgi:hypothetical protein
MLVSAFRHDDIRKWDLPKSLCGEDEGRGVAHHVQRSLATCAHALLSHTADIEEKLRIMSGRPRHTCTHAHTDFQAQVMLSCCTLHVDFTSSRTIGANSGWAGDGGVGLRIMSASLATPARTYRHGSETIFER